MTEVETILAVTREQIAGLYPDRPLWITKEHTPDKFYWIQDGMFVPTPLPDGEVGR